MTPAVLPEVKIRPVGPWVLVLVEPLAQKSELIELVHSVYDEGSTPGFGHVLAAAASYLHVPPKKWGEKKVVQPEEKTHEYPIEVCRGDRVLFRRWLRTQGLMQPGEKAVSAEAVREFPDHTFLFIHYHDIEGVVCEGEEM